MAEVADFLDLNECDGYLPPRTYQPPRALLAPNKVIAQLASVSQFTTAPSYQSFDILVHFIAVQLLASCYTILPATSASNLPLVQQRRGSRLITALRLHSYYRFTPAVGHHAREPSETSPWPGLYSGQSAEEGMADLTLRQWRLGKYNADLQDARRSSAYLERTREVSESSDGTTDNPQTTTNPPPRSQPQTQPQSPFVSNLIQ
ncbi:hypothetical protein CC80DRAFT_4302 [Byssothecium circinans]|uniref:Uncharacterized protein n=1 Tax=Byssothecium circinans TaxID=147558 RepID=A0A6A5UEN3_9PLEO|nr:hypothetical protein CC80DRAFT_4302 [Byssothecium circinans]